MKIVSNGKTLEVPSCGSQDIYSTEEQQIGTWIDGKPLYRKVLNITMGNVNIETKHTTLGYVDSMILIRFIIYGKAGGTIMFPNGFGYVVFSSSNKGLLSKVNADDLANQPAKAIIEYTKDNDQVTVELPTMVTNAKITTANDFYEDYDKEVSE